MNSIQAKMMELLVEFDSICKEHNISYCVSSGCALGLERNGGFLPWDDDIDLFIERHEYNRLNEIFAKNIREDRAWLTEENYPGYENPLVRYVDLTTTEILRSRIDDGSPLGMYIEFFVLDPYPSDEQKQKEFDKYLWLYCELQATRYVVANSKRFKDVYDEALYKEYYSRMQVEGKRAVLKEINDKYLTYNRDDCELLCAKWGTQKAIVRKEWMDSLVYRNFEGNQLPFFKDNIEYLYFTEYGYDWNIIPAVSARESHGNILNVNHSYKEHLNKLKTASNFFGLVKSMEDNKKANLERKFADLNVQEQVGIQKKALLEKMGEELDKYDLSTSFDRLPELRQILKPYMDIQLQQRYYVTGISAMISEKVFAAMMFVLTYDNRIIMAQKVLDLYKEYNNYPYYQELVNLISTTKKEKYKNNIDNVKNAIAKLDSFGFEYQIEVERGKMWLITRRNIDITENKIMNYYSTMEHQEDLEIKKYIGDFYYNAKDYIGADKWYSQAKDSSNGMILFDMKKKGFF